MGTKKLLAMTALLTPLVAACGGSEANATQAPVVAQAAAEAPAGPAATGTVIEVRMVTDDRGNYFEPADFAVKPGDVIRFVLVSGVHNVSFPADRNAGGLTLPAASDYLQLPGQTFDLLVDLPPGEYFYQCDPHALLGMVGTITVGG